MKNNYRIIGVCLARLQEEEYYRCIKEINKHAVSAGCRLILYNSCADLYLKDNISDMTEKSVFQLIEYDMLDAMIIMGETLKDEALLQRIADNCRKKNIPVITVDHPMERCINFTFDYSQTFEKLCRHIIEDHGFRRVNMIAGMQGNAFSEERVDAYKKVLRENGIPFKSAYLGYGDFWDAPTKAVLSGWFDCDEPDIPEAIVCANDSMAVTAGRFLQSKGYRIPEDIVITGFDGIMEAEYFVPPITTCTKDYEEMGRKIIEVINMSLDGKPCSKNISVDFHIRRSQSCGCISSVPYNTNMLMGDVLERLRMSQMRQAATCDLQIAVGNMTSLTQLPEIVTDKFTFHSIAIAVNEDIFRAPSFGEKYRGDSAFSESMNIIYQRFDWVDMEPCIISRHGVIPDFERMLERTDPIIICTMHFMDLVLGYCVFQPEIDYNEFEKIHSFMHAIDSSLGNFRNQMHIKYINTQLVSANDELEKLYIHDHMTGLFNRRGFYRQFGEQYEEAKDKSLYIVIISADLDELKTINDTYGHKEGDNAIITVGHALLTSAIQGEICARFGGDEFTVAGIVSYSHSYFDNFRNRFHSCLREYNASSGKPYEIGASIGFCAQPVSTHFTLEQMIKIADDMMYQDKVNRKKTRSWRKEGRHYNV